MTGDELNNVPEEAEQEEQETEQKQASGEPDKEQPIGQWWQPNDGYVETPIGGHVFPDKSRQAAGME